VLHLPISDKDDRREYRIIVEATPCITQSIP